MTTQPPVSDPSAPVVPASDETAHDDKCEAEFIEGPMLYTACCCAARADSLSALIKEVQAPTDSESPDAPHNADIWELRWRITRLVDALREVSR